MMKKIVFVFSMLIFICLSLMSCNKTSEVSGTEALNLLNYELVDVNVNETSYGGYNIVSNWKISIRGIYQDTYELKRIISSDNGGGVGSILNIDNENCKLTYSCPTSVEKGSHYYFWHWDFADEGNNITHGSFSVNEQFDENVLSEYINNNEKAMKFFKEKCKPGESIKDIKISVIKKK